MAVIEDAGQVPIDQKICHHRLRLQSVKSHMAELDQQAKPIHRAPPLSVAMVIALKVFVCSEEEPKYARAIAWIALVCIWACMRLSDLEGLLPGRISVSDSNENNRPRKTGERGSDFHCAKCLLEWYGLDEERLVYLGVLWRHKPGLFCFRIKAGHGRAKYVKFASVERIASYVRMIFSMLKRPSKQRYAGWRCKSEPLLPKDGIMFWSGHSTRHFLPSVAASIQVGKEQRDYLGRWHVGLHQSSDYARTSRQIVTDVQEKVSKSICAGNPMYDESELLSEFGAFLEARGAMPSEPVSYHNECLVE